jgi:hypothetical protein
VLSKKWRQLESGDGDRYGGGGQIELFGISIVGKTKAKAMQ